uniref:Uncharacterized protein n=1 Tax=Toxoplasma gondii COUG TaxID=1074873 RepID=A0A2G8XN85_TOXGO|nr:hypothetical protein TGCOUG_238895 [Toxoplasma gondii COUG]
MMDVQSFISGLAGGVQKPIPTQEMRLFMQQQRAAGPPAAATVLQEPRVWAQQHHTQAQNSLPFHGCTNGAGSFQPFYPQHSGLSGDHASFHLNRQPATAIGVPWMSQCGMPNGQRANGYCLPNHYNNPIANSKPAVSNECRPTPLPAPATTTSPCVQARSVAGAGGSQSFEGRKSTSLENPWQDAPRTTSQIQREASPSFRHFDLKEPMAMMDANQPCQVYASQSSTPPSVTHIRHEADPVNMSSVVICKPTLAADRTLPRAQRIPGVLNQTECGRPQAPDTTPHRRLRSSSALPLQSSGSPDTPNSVLGASRRSLSSSGARTRMNQNDGSDWTAAQGDDSVKTAEQAPSGHGRLIESAVETLPSVNPPRPNLSSSTRLQSYEQCVSEESAGALAADTSGVTAGSRKPTMNAQRIAGSRRPAPRTCASVGTINPRNVSNIGEKYKDRLLSSNADRKCSRPEMRKSLWEANTKTRVCPTTSALPRSDIAAPVTANPTHKSKASPNSTVRGSALSGGRSRGNRGLNVRSSSKESEASDTKMLGEVKPPTAGALSTDQSRLAALSRAAVAPGKALPRGVQKNPSNPLLTSDSGRGTALTEKIPPSRRGIPTLTRLELGKHSRSTDRRHSDLSASHGRLPPLSGKVDGEECDIGESYARRRRYSMLRRGTVSSPVSRLVSAEGNSRTAARSGTGTRPRPETVAERAPRRPGLNSILRNSNGTDSLKTRTFGARSGVLRAAASRKQSAGVPSGNEEGNRSRESSSTVGGRRLESGDSKSTGGTSRSTSSLESAVLPEVSLPQDDDTHSDLCGKVRDALLQGSGMEESRLENSVRFSRFESGLDEEPNIDEDEVVLSGHSDVTTGPFLGIEVLHEDRRHSKPASDSQTTCLHPDYRRTRSLPGEEELKGGAALNETRMTQACGTVMPPNRKTQNSTMPAVMKDETTVQSTTPSEGAAMSERSTSVSRGGCSTPPRSVSDVSGPQTWEVSSAAVTPVVEDVVLDDASVTVVPGRTGAAAGVGITKQGLLREAPLVSDHEAISQPERDSATMSLDREAAEFTTGERRRETVSAVTEAAHVLTSNSCHVPGRESRGKINQAAGNPCCPGAVTHQQPGVEESAYYSQAQSDVLIASGAHHLSAPREQMSLPVEQNTAEITDQACAKRSKTPNEKGEVRPSTLSVESSAECAKDQQNPGIFPQAASKAPTGACVSPLEASASIPDSASAAAQHAQAEEQLRQQVRAKIEHKFRQLQDEQLRQHCLAQQQQQLLQQVNLRKKEALQQAEQRAQMVQQQIHTQKLGQGLVKVSQVQPGTSVTVPGPVNHQHPNLQRPAVHHLAGIAQPQGIGESAKSLTGYPNLRQLSGVHQEPQQRVVLRPAVSEQQLRRPTLSHSPARRAVPEQEQRVGGETQQSNIASHEAAAGQARAAELQRRLEIVRETNILRAFYSSAEVRTPAFAVAAMEETHLDCHGDRDPHRPLRAPSAKGEPLSALARRYLHSQSLTASACHPTGRQEHEAFVRELWSEKHRTQQDELRRNLALYQQGRPNGLAAAGIDPAAAFNALRVSETAFQQPTAVSFVGPCPTAGAPLPMTGAGSIEEPFPLVAPSSLARPGPSPLSAGMCHLPMGDKGRADVSPMANLSRFVRERHVVAHPVVAVGNHVPM